MSEPKIEIKAPNSSLQNITASMGDVMRKIKSADAEFVVLFVVYLLYSAYTTSAGRVVPDTTEEMSRIVLVGTLCIQMIRLVGDIVLKWRNGREDTNGTDYPIRHK